MARFREWIDLGKSTLGSLSARDVTGFYSAEWPETQKMLVTDHQSAIENERRRIRRWFKIVNAIFFGLAKRLSPLRRILFVLAQVGFVLCLFSLAAKFDEPPFKTFIELALTFGVMTLLLAMELIDKIKIRDELTLARDLQASLIPAIPPATEHYDIAAFNYIANTVGGDIYDFVPLPDGRVAVLFGDASGHGMAAGLVMAVAHAAFRTQLEIDASPPAITSSLNRILCRTGTSRSFFSCCYILLAADGSFVATFAGHPEALKVSSDGRVSARIGRGSYPLGVKSGLVWEEVRGALAPGERLLLHSDGLTEARNEAGVEFGDAYVEAIAARNADGPAQTVVDHLVTEWRLFTGTSAAEDDVSIAVIRRR